MNNKLTGLSWKEHTPNPLSQTHKAFAQRGQKNTPPTPSRKRASFRAEGALRDLKFFLNDERRIFFWKSYKDKTIDR